MLLHLQLSEREAGQPPFLAHQRCQRSVLGHRPDTYERCKVHVPALRRKAVAQRLQHGTDYSDPHGAPQTERGDQCRRGGEARQREQRRGAREAAPLEDAPAQDLHLCRSDGRPSELAASTVTQPSRPLLHSR